jgi:glycosyltransferase involved in cell wall biosynthesis
LKKPTILFLIDDLRSGGAQRQLVALAEGFKLRKYTVEIVHYYPHFYYEEYLCSRGIPFKYIQSNGPFSRVFQVRRYLLNNRPGVVIAFMSVPALLALSATFPFKFFKLFIGERSSDPKILTSFKSILIRLFYGRADGIISNSESNIGILAKVNPFLSGQKMHVIYNAIDLYRYHQDCTYKFKFDGVTRVIVPASYRKLKNILGLINALSSLDMYYKARIRIDWYGDKSYNSHTDNVLLESERLIDSLNLKEQIRLHDVVGNIESLIVKYDAVGLFSFYEGLPNSICEGMACGKPIFCSAVSDLPNLIAESENGFLFDPCSIESIRLALVKLISCSSEHMRQIGNNNRFKAQKLFDGDLIIKQYENLINE